MLSVSTSHFQYNGAEFGRVMLLASHCTVIINQSIFFENNGRFSGVIGLIFNNVAIIHCEFNNNRAKAQGAVVQGNFRPSLYIGNCSFNSNVANLLGGGVIILEQSKASLLMEVILLKIDQFITWEVYFY